MPWWLAGPLWDSGETGGFYLSKLNCCTTTSQLAMRHGPVTSKSDRLKSRLIVAMRSWMRAMQLSVKTGKRSMPFDTSWIRGADSWPETCQVCRNSRVDGARGRTGTFTLAVASAGAAWFTAFVPKREQSLHGRVDHTSCLHSARDSSAKSLFMRRLRPSKVF